MTMPRSSIIPCIFIPVALGGEIVEKPCTTQTIVYCNTMPETFIPFHTSMQLKTVPLYRRGKQISSLFEVRCFCCSRSIICFCIFCVCSILQRLKQCHVDTHTNMNYKGFSYQCAALYRSVGIDLFFGCNNLLHCQM